RQQAPARATLAVVVKKLHEQDDLACRDCILQLNGMAWDEPTAKRRSERVGLGLQPRSQSIREGTNRRGNQLPVGRKGQVPQGRRALPAPYRRCENAT